MKSEEWQSCPAGLIGEMVEHRRRRRQHRMVVRATGWGSLAVLLLIGIVVTSQLSTSRDGDRLTCVQAAELFAQHHDGQLDRATRDKVDAHLRQCAPCRERYERLMSREAKAREAKAREVGHLVGMILRLR